MKSALSERSMEVFREALRALNEAGVPYVVGGAFAVHHYTGYWRNTHDLDLYMERQNVSQAVESLVNVGFQDDGEAAAGDRDWIYHMVKDEVMIDVIWQPPNHLDPVNAGFHEWGEEATFLETPVRFMPREELVWSKIFTLNHHRCDWPDVFRVIRACSPDFDWQRLMEKLGEHWPVLLAFIVLYDWVYPQESGCIPDSVRQELMRRKAEWPIEANQPLREMVLDPWIYTRPLAP